MGRYLAERDYCVRLVPFPNNAADGCVVTDPDGSGFYTIVINANISRERQLNAFRHELNHLENEDLYSDKPICDVERKMVI